MRRSVLSLSKESPISDDRIEMCVNHAIKHAPSPFNVQSCRAMILFGAEHERLWDIGMSTAKKTMPAPVFAQYELKNQGFRDGYGTVSHPAQPSREKLTLLLRFCSSRMLMPPNLFHCRSRTYCPSTQIVRYLNYHQTYFKLSNQLNRV